MTRGCGSYCLLPCHLNSSLPWSCAWKHPSHRSAGRAETKTSTLSALLPAFREEPCRYERVPSGPWDDPLGVMARTFPATFQGIMAHNSVSEEGDRQVWRYKRVKRREDQPHATFHSLSLSLVPVLPLSFIGLSSQTIAARWWPPCCFIISTHTGWQCSCKHRFTTSLCVMRSGVSPGRKWYVPSHLPLILLFHRGYLMGAQAVLKPYKSAWSVKRVFCQRCLRKPLPTRAAVCCGTQCVCVCIVIVKPQLSLYLFHLSGFLGKRESERCRLIEDRSGLSLGAQGPIKTRPTCSNNQLSTALCLRRSLCISLVGWPVFFHILIPLQLHFRILFWRFLPNVSKNVHVTLNIWRHEIKCSIRYCVLKEQFTHT